MAGQNAEPTPHDQQPIDPADIPADADTPAAEPVEETPPAPLLTLRDGLPEITETDAQLADVISRMAAGTGPIAIDAERASGYRYSPRAYLIQLRREGSGTALVDPIAYDDLRALGEAFGDAEWILHAASQDIPCLREVGLVPTRLFDTELAARLVGYPRVGLATLVEVIMGQSMRKEHSAVDWSKRPLPKPWLEYAALDVEVLLELREVIGARLEESGKAEWAEAGVPAPDRPRAPSSPGPVAAYLWHPQGQGPALPGRRTRAVDGAGRDRPAARHHPRPAGPRLGADRRRERDADEHGCPPRHAWLPRPGRPEVRRPVARRGGTRAQAARHRAAPADHPHRRTTGAARVGGAGPGRRGPPRHREGADHGVRGGAPGADREPADPGLPAAGPVEAARRRQGGHGGGSRRGAGGSRRAALADRDHRADPHHGDPGPEADARPRSRRSRLSPRASRRDWRTGWPSRDRTSGSTPRRSPPAVPAAAGSPAGRTAASAAARQSPSPAATVGRAREQLGVAHLAGEHVSVQRSLAAAAGRRRR